LGNSVFDHAAFEDAVLDEEDHEDRELEAALDLSRDARRGELHSGNDGHSYGSPEDVLEDVPAFVAHSRSSSVSRPIAGPFDDEGPEPDPAALRGLKWLKRNVSSLRVTVSLQRSPQPASSRNRSPRD